MHGPRRAQVKAQVVARNAAADGATGAAAGLLIACALIACNPDWRESFTQTGAPVASLFSLAALACAQAAAVAGVGGALLRKFTAPD